MPKERYYVPQELAVHQHVKIEGPESHHLATVMRATEGEQVELINGQGVLAQATILQIGKKSVQVVVDTIQSSNPQFEQLILIQAIPKINRLDYIIEKGTELGMSSLWLFPGQRSEKKELTHNQLERLQHLSIAAMKQCGRLFLPEIKILPPILKWKSVNLPLYFGSLDPQAPLFIQQLERSSTLNASFCVGPEGGFTDEEEACLKALGGSGVKLHKNILRTETAAIAGLVLLSHLQPKNGDSNAPQM